ncbi:MAG: DUF6443 domain-containing protein, partial [Bacteroidota bacterium]
QELDQNYLNSMSAVGTPVGGLRIARTNSEGVIKRYVYQEFDHPSDPNRSSGRLSTQPIYFYNQRQFRSDEGYCTFRALSSSSKLPLGSFQGSHVAYRTVSVLIGEHGGGGKSEYTYSHYTDLGGSILPTTPPTSNDWKRGLLLQSVDYKNEGGNFTEVRKIINNYDLREDESLNNHEIWGLTIGIRTIGHYDLPNTNPLVWNDRFVFNSYRTISPWYYLASKEEILDGVSTLTNYEYDPTHLNVIASTFRNSDNKIHRTETDYVGELGFTSLGPIRMTSIPKEVRNLVDGVVQSGATLNYQFFGDLVLPSAHLQILEGGTHLLRGVMDYYTTTSGDGVTGLLKSYNQSGHVFTEQYAYHQGIDEGLLKTKTYGNWVTHYTYHPDSRLLKKLTDIDGIATHFFYDDFQRLAHLGARNNQLIQSFKYRYTLAGGGMPNVIETYSGEDNVTRFQYFDGLGRPLQTVARQYSPAKKDVIHQAVEYDEYGRPTKQYQPINTVTNTDGAYMTPSISSTTCYDEILYENSPLNREIGRQFCDFGQISTTYSNGGGIQNVMTGGTYGPGELYRVDNTDENLHVTTTFTDKIGQLILTRRYESGQNIDTYNGYDDRGNLKEVLSPMSSIAGDLFSYTYTYDERNRLTSKILPNGVASSYTYFNHDQIKTSTENGKQLWYQYNDYLQNTYVFTEDPTITGNTAYQTAYLRNDYDNTGGTKETGKVIQSMARNLHDVSQELFSQYNYDKLGRLQSTKTDTPLGFQEISETAYDGATDRVKGTLQLYQSEMAIELNVFDHAKRLTDQYFQSNISSGHISSNTYNY